MHAQVGEERGSIRLAPHKEAIVDVRVRPQSAALIEDWHPGSGAEDIVASTEITATKTSACRVTV